jgi:hypothetical protein
MFDSSYTFFSFQSHFFYNFLQPLSTNWFSFNTHLVDIEQAAKAVQLKYGEPIHGLFAQQ